MAAAESATSSTEQLWATLSGFESKSLLKKHLTPAIYEQLKDKTTASGVTLGDCIRSGVENPDSGVGVYAPEPEAYTVFAALFDPLIDDYHKGHGPEATHPEADLDPAKLPPFPDLDPANEFILSTRIRVARNLGGYGLGPVLTQDQRLDIQKKVSDVLTAIEGDLAGEYYPLDGMDEATRERLVADHFLFKRGDRFLESAGINSFWPHGRGIFHNADKTFLVWVNEEDELRIISMEKGGDVGRVFKRLCAGVHAIQQSCSFLFNEHHGYLSSCPTNLGTGMRASVHIKIPLVSALPEFNAICEKYGIQPRGIHGEHSESAGGVWDLSNKRRLGLGEVDCVQQMYDGVKAMIEKEKELQAAQA